MIVEPYTPCVTGLHVCGKSRDEMTAITVDNMPMRSQRRAELAWRAVIHEFEEVPGDEADLMLDLQKGGDCNETFGIRRQWLGRIRQIVEAQNA